MDNIEHLESKLLELQNEIDLLQKKMDLTDSEQRTSSINNKSELKKNSFEMKQLRIQVEELQVRLKRQQLTDFKLMQEALHEKFKEPAEFKANSAQEMLQLMDCRLLHLSDKHGNLSHNLKILERTFNKNECLLKEMTDACRRDDIPSEADCIQQMRHLDTEQYKTLKNIEDCEMTRDKLKDMLAYIRKKHCGLFRLFMDLKTEKSKIESNEDEEDKKEKYSERSEIEKKEKRLQKLEKDISMVKDATGCHDIQDIDSAFLEQKLIKEDMLGLVKKAERRLSDLRDEKRNLESKRSLMNEADSVYPKNDKSVLLAKNRLKEQELRKDTAKSELERLNSASDQTKQVLQRLITKMQPKVNKKDLNNKDIRRLAKQFQNIVTYTFPSTEQTLSAKNRRG